MELVCFVIVIIAFITAMLVLGEKILIKHIVCPSEESVTDQSFVAQKFPNENRFTFNSSSDSSVLLTYIPSNNEEAPHKKVVVILGEYGCSVDSLRKYASIFWKRGFSVVIPDGNYAQNGYVGLVEQNKSALSAVFDFVSNPVNGYEQIGIFGLSYGAVQSLAFLSQENIPNLKFVIADSAFSDLYSFLKERVRYDFRIKPFPMLTIARLIIKRKFRADLKNVSPIKSVGQSGSIPIFFIHSDRDMFVSPQESVEMYNAKSNGYKKIYIAQSSVHCGALDSDPDAYTQKIYEFLNKINQ